MFIQIFLLLQNFKNCVAKIYEIFEIELFVFVVQWANKAAETVMQGAFNTIIGWHENQPETKKHLDVSFE
mgnify:CR=1 FL=1